MNVNKALDSVIEHLRQGNLQRAKGICRKILKQKPNDPDALHLLGMIYSEAGDYNQAVTHIQKALQADPHFAEAYNNLGNIYQKTKLLDKALESYQKALALNPSLSESCFNLGIVLQDLGKTDNAIASYQKVIEIRPDHFGAYNNLGLALQKEGQTDEAISCYRKSLQINPQFADAHYNLANTLKIKGQRAEAQASYQKAIALNPDFAEAFNNLGILLKEEGYLDDAIASYMRALEIKSDYVEAYTNLGAAYLAKGHLSKAISYSQKAIMIDAHYADAYNILANACKDYGNLYEAERYFRRALEIQSDNSTVYSNLLLMMNYDSRYTAKAVFAEHLKFAKQIAEPLYPASFRYSNDRSPSRRLKIGYVSPDFRRHSVNYFLEPVLRSHNHERFEVFCYSDVLIPDNVTERLRGYADQWRDIAGLPDQQVVELVQKDEIDILIDLAGHTGYNRMLLFARKPAPIQVSWLGYPNTTGLSAIDYRIVDSYTDPPGLTDPFYTEKLTRMPDSFLCYQPDTDSPDIGPLPALAAGHITFGSFNNFTKETPEVLSQWAEIMKRIQGSRLILKARSFGDSIICGNVLDIFGQSGIAPERIELLSYLNTFSEHIGLYKRIDLGLDPFPYNGTTTTCEALWMGVPVLTLSGITHASRVGVSLLSNVGLQDLIAASAEEYLDKAIQLAHNIENLGYFRATLRARMAESPLTAAKQFTANLEICYRKIWTQWCVEAEK